MNVQEKLTTTQRGKIAELHVATALMAQSAGRLPPFEPMSDDHGIDLVVLDKVTGRALPIQVKAWFLMPDRRGNTVQFDVRKATHSSDQLGVVICVVLDPETLQIKVSWVIPINKISTVGTDRPEKYALAPSILESSDDKYTSYRQHSLAGLEAAVTRILSE